MINIYVGNLPYAAQENELVEYFRQWGAVSRATLVFDRETGRPRGFGFVEMDDPAEAQRAIEAAHGATFNGRPLTVNQARPRAGGPPPAAAAETSPASESGGVGPGPVDTVSDDPGDVGSGYSNRLYS